MRKQIEVLEHQSESLAYLLKFGMRSIDDTAVFLMSRHFSGIGKHAAIHGFKHTGASEQSGLAGARRSDNGYHFTLTY